MSESPLVLLVDDDAAVCWALEQCLQDAGFAVQVAPNAQRALKELQRASPAVILTDVRMPGMSGLDLLAMVRQDHSHVPVVVMTAHGTMETAMAAVKAGAFDYIAKPIDEDRLIALLRQASGEATLAATSHGGAADSMLVGSSAVMQECYRRLAAAAHAGDMGVLITGPSGAGKELFARALHQYGARSDGPFVALNCSALPDHLVESELFGHEAGAFTDAKQLKIGHVEAADGGTLFLDEVGELPLTTQAKLLRVLDDQHLRRLGGQDEIAVRVRVVAATNRDLDAMVEDGSFRADLAYRLNIVRIQVPPLASRPDDIPDLVRHFLHRSGQRLQRDLAITDEALKELCQYSWPGNVRQLKHCLEEAAVLATGGIIAVDHLAIQGHAEVHEGHDLASMVGRALADHPGNAHAQLHDELDRLLIKAALAETQGNQLRAAELLGINRITLKKRLDALLG